MTTKKTKENKKSKVNHDHVCDICGKPATINLQETYQEFSIDKHGNFEEKDNWEGSVNDFYCDKCYEMKKLYN